MASRSTGAVGVSFVVAGTTDPDLLTVRGHTLLATCDVVLCDPDLVDLAAQVATGEVVLTQDSNGTPLSLAARTKFMSDARKAGRTVARLMSGDPVLEIGRAHV